jgi:ABC-type amino acid transport substrate-binding protein
MVAKVGAGADAVILPIRGGRIALKGVGVMRTLIAGTLTILSAYPDPPFDIMKDGGGTGFDVELMRAVCGRLSLELRPLASRSDKKGNFRA